MKPTFIRVGKPKTITRAPATVLPPTQGSAVNPATPATGDVVTFTENTTDPTIDFPNSIVAGDYVVLWVRDNSSTPSGWTQLGTANPYTAVDTLYGKVVTSADVSAGTFTLPASAVTRGFVVRFDGTGSNWATSAPSPTVPSFSNNTNSQPDPPAAAPSAGQYWSLAGFHSNDSVVSEVGITSFPGYTDLASLGSGGLTNYHGHVAIRAVDVTTNEDPGAGYHSMSVTRGWVAFTMLLAIPSAGDPSVVGWPVTASDIDTESATDGQVLTSDGAGNAAWEDVPPGVTNGDSHDHSGGDGAQIDHGGLAGLTDDDHTQYVLADGTRAFTGAQSMGSNKLTNVTDPTSAQDAATKAYVDAAAAYYELIVASTDSTIDRFVATADKTIANTTTETTMFGTGEGNLTFPAGFFTAGKAIRVLMRGQLSDTGTPNFTIKMKLGSTVIDSVGPTALTGITDVEWMLDGLITCRSTGASGTFVGGGLFDYDDGSELSLGSGSDVSVDTTASQTLDITWEWGTASASNTITVREAAVTLIDPNRDGIGGLEPVFTEAGDDYVYGLVP